MPVVHFRFASVDATLTSGTITVWSPRLRPGGTAAITGEKRETLLVSGEASLPLEPGPVVGHITGDGATHQLKFTVPSQDATVEFLDLLEEGYSYEPEIVQAAQQAAREARAAAAEAKAEADRAVSVIGSAERVLQAEAAAKASETAAANSASAAASSASAAADSSGKSSLSAEAAAASASEAEAAAASAVNDVTDALSAKVAAAESAEKAAAGSASASASSASSANAAASDAASMAGAASESADAASASASAAKSAQSGAELARDAAGVSSTSASGSASAAATSAASAKSAAEKAASDVKASLSDDVAASQSARDEAKASATSADDSADRAEAAAASASEVVSSGVPNATATVAGKLRLAGDLGGTSDAPTVPGLAGKAEASAVADAVSKAASATSNPTANTLMLRSGSGTVDVADPTAAKNAANKQYVDSSITSRAVALTGDQAVAGVKNFATAPQVGGVAVVKSDDSRLTDSRTPIAHTHTASQITDFTAATDARIAAKGVAAHTHAISEIVGLPEALASAGSVKPADLVPIKWACGLYGEASTVVRTANWGNAELGLETSNANNTSAMWSSNHLFATQTGTYRITVSGSRKGSSGTVSVWTSYNKVETSRMSTTALTQWDQSVEVDLASGAMIGMRWTGSAGNSFSYTVTVERI